MTQQQKKKSSRVHTGRLDEAIGLFDPLDHTHFTVSADGGGDLFAVAVHLFS